MDIITLALAKKYADEKLTNIDGLSVQSDWNQEDETASDYIKNKPELITKEVMFQLLVEGKVIDPVSDVTDKIYTDANGSVLCL